MLQKPSCQFKQKGLYPDSPQDGLVAKLKKDGIKYLNRLIILKNFKQAKTYLRPLALIRLAMHPFLSRLLEGTSEKGKSISGHVVADPPPFFLRQPAETPG